MKVSLRISEKGSARHIELVVGGENLIPITVKVSAEISAQMAVEAGDEPGLYILQLGNQPDIRADADVQEGDSSCVFLWHKYDPGQGRDVAIRAFRLFQGTMGTSYLYLVKYGDGGHAVPLAEVTVLLDETDFRGALYDDMVQELLCRRLPHFVLDDFKWQMARNQFSMGWDDGYASTESPDVMLRALGRVVARMRKLLAYINESPHMSVVRTVRRQRIGQLSRVDENVVRGVGSVINRLGVKSICEMSDERIWATSRRAVFQTSAHDVIFSFLKSFVTRRLDIIDRNLADRIIHQKGKLSEFQPTVIPQPSRRNIYMDERAILDSLIRKQSLVRRLSRIVMGMMSYDFLSFPHKELSVFDVAADDFSANDVYRQLYRLILDFSRARFWWVGDGKDGVWRIPKVELCENGESRLQLKYSIVYENWCYARLVAAMYSIGFECREHKASMDGESSYAVFINGALQVTLIHGVTAWARKRKFNADFVYTGGRAGKKTPDFAILISKRGGERTVWAVADAKSDARLRRHIVDRRIEYASTIEWKGNLPFASIIFISGEADGDKAGLDFPPPPLNDVRSSEINAEDALDDHSDDDYYWTLQDGIKEGEHGTLPYHGHVRANVLSDTNDRGVFCDFMHGLCRTALRLLS